MTTKTWLNGRNPWKEVPGRPHLWHCHSAYTTKAGRNNHYLLTIKNVWNDACYEEIHILEEKKQQRKKTAQGQKGSQQVGTTFCWAGSDSPSSMRTINPAMSWEYIRSTKFRSQRGPPWRWGYRDSQSQHLHPLISKWDQKWLYQRTKWVSVKLFKVSA